MPLVLLRFLTFFLAISGTAGILVGMIVLGLELQVTGITRNRAALLGFGGVVALFVAVALFISTGGPAAIR